MSSIFVRPDSPPPRQPSPDFLPAPLPYPHHPRRIASQPKIRVHSPSIPPGLHGRNKTLQSARSCDFVSSRPSESRDEQDPRCSSSSSSSDHGLRHFRARTRSPNLTVSSMSSPRSSPGPSARNSPDFIPHHRRTLSVAFAFPSTPSSRSTSPTAVDSQVPPVPLVPYRYTGPQHIVCPTPLPLNKPIIFTNRDVEVAEILLEVPSTPSPPLGEKASEGKDVLPPLEKHKSMGMACLKFFGIRSTSTRQSPPRPAVTAM
ncbi:hypothetical protein CVT25_004018 [Psilocybe cyanescens]|uniref:Uncharacterized protein n=1 Tax=Psilocybe cyanescens TaxID=93625 RepID=A0A409WXN2_PSICY|nr:hypothetical protein CVT25_004018 [Psilocybe cyanescens]